MTNDPHAAMTLPDGAPDGLALATALTPAEQREALARVHALSYTHDVFRGRAMRRGYAQFGHAYVSVGRRLEAVTPIPPWLAELASQTLSRVGASWRAFDQAIVTRYPKGAGIGWHTDAAVFGPQVMILSLGAAARLQLRRDPSDRAPLTLELQPGSALLLAGLARARWQHRVPPVTALRYSITLRHVARPTG
ncbi:MAG: alpha-ketoglutarate-dependent dioxygenase AlkB [Myxococcales bacterium]|nr:alpha-ketoglutarate-dependent dioxygenase AlkB [Myxococcales bacterium]MCB9753995.1 alpha-ketoglutarate-dependent dioxygenase AlkB [Myxococcales bacterium]